MKTEYRSNPGFGQMDSVEREENDKALSTDNQETREQDGADLLEEILGRDNLNRAYLQVRSNKGAPGIDGMSVEDAGPWLQENKAARCHHYWQTSISTNSTTKPRTKE